LLLLIEEIISKSSELLEFLHKFGKPAAKPRMGRFNDY
jgi:hypothetical protein